MLFDRYFNNKKMQQIYLSSGSCMNIYFDYSCCENSYYPLGTYFFQVKLSQNMS